ncbi:TetR family transcriptional regulator [Rhodococcus sp. EPR-157]|uniref:TetR/AcrR family transcriptional regulator n=1 Tax=Rhodococcus sp. EPR-157 TaxID=1813677 RepID=UPI0007BBDF7A|nr:TetR/AcrR family transcriptional regulator [Rhodococcus sp. EPR-157]KZE99374.1 TetR family transcriptional regulator [Rhodococcus sp. EPR-157]
MVNSSDTSARSKILTAAHPLFVGGGYASTTIKQIATDAGVAVQTVYFVFGNKRAVLEAVLDRAIAGDELPIATLDRQWVAAAVAASDPAEHLRIHVHAASLVSERVAGILLAVRAGAHADPDVAALWRTNVEQRVIVLRHLMTSLAQKVDGMDVETCVDVALALLSPENFTLLVDDRGWTTEEYEAWVVEGLAAAAECG